MLLSFFLAFVEGAFALKAVEREVSSQQTRWEKHPDW